MRVFHLNWRRLRLQLQRHLPPALVATTLWLVWALLALALRGREDGQFLALLLLGLFVLGGGTLAALCGPSTPCAGSVSGTPRSRRS